MIASTNMEYKRRLQLLFDNKYIINNKNLDEKIQIAHENSDSQNQPHKESIDFNKVIGYFDNQGTLDGESIKGLTWKEFIQKIIFSDDDSSFHRESSKALIYKDAYKVSGFIDIFKDTDISKPLEKKELDIVRNNFKLLIEETRDDDNPFSHIIVGKKDDQYYIYSGVHRATYAKLLNLHNVIVYVFEF